MDYFDNIKLKSEMWNYSKKYIIKIYCAKM